MRPPTVARATGSLGDSAHGVATAALPEQVRVGDEIGEALAGAQIILGVTPSAHARAVYSAAASNVSKRAIFVSVTKGLEPATHMRASQVIAEVIPSSLDPQIAVLTAASDQHLNFLLTKRGQWEHVQLSMGISRVLVDFLGFGESWIFLAWGNERATGRRTEGEAAGIAEYSTASAPGHNENSVGEAGTGSEPAEPISFADVVRMTHKQACQPDALLQALHASPERTRDV